MLRLACQKKEVRMAFLAKEQRHLRMRSLKLCSFPAYPALGFVSMSGRTDICGFTGLKKNNRKLKRILTEWNSCFLQEVADLVIVVVKQVQSRSSKVVSIVVV